MNALADTYIPDRLAALRVSIAAAWQVHCIELDVSEAEETAEVAA